MRILGQPGQHRGLSGTQRSEGLAEIRLGRRFKAIGPRTQIDLVHVELQNLVFAELGLDFERQQCFFDLALQGARAAQKEGARHLLRDGGCPLGAPASEVSHDSPGHANRVQPAVFIKPRVLHCKQTVFHQLGNLVDRLVNPALGAETCHFHPIRGQHTQGLLGLVVGERRGVGQLSGEKRGERQQGDEAQAGQHQTDFQEAQGPGAPGDGLHGDSQLDRALWAARAPAGGPLCKRYEIRS